jgi:hypothetical protein
MIVFNLDESPDRFGVVNTFIEQEIAGQPAEVKAAVATYANGNPGAARLIARRCKTFTTKAEVEELIGWPLSGERKEQGHEIYDRLKGA